jgi:Tfp pilus assembly PilM family ATPase
MLQHRELGLLPPREAVLDANILRRSKKDVASDEILSVSMPRPRLEERMRLLRQAAVDVKILDVEPLALLNGAIHLTALEAGELLVLLTVGERMSVLCLFSEQGPVVARYLDVGAEMFLEQLRATFPTLVRGAKDLASMIPASEIAKGEAACRELVDRMAEDIRLSLTFYRTEYDRESLPRYAISGLLDLPYIGRWVAERLGLGAPLEVLDPFSAIEVKISRTGADSAASGPSFLQAFGLALRGV